MEMFLVVFVVMLTLITLMAIGVIFGRKPIAGSCGGMSALGMEVACDICKGDLSKCETENEKVNFNSDGTDNGNSPFYDAMKKNGRA